MCTRVFLRQYGRGSACRPCLVAIPYAGADVRAYDGWRGQLDPSIALLVAQLPGRVGERTGGVSRSRCAHLYAEAISADLAKLPFLREQRPIWIFGHSMGALLAYELAYRLEGRVPLEGLIVSGRQSPSIPVVSRLFDASEEAIVRAVGEYGGTPTALLNCRGFREYLVPVLRDDFAVTETYRLPVREKKLQVPVFVVGGERDPLITHAKLEAWTDVTEGEVSVSWYEGGHFFLRENEPAFVDFLNRLLMGGKDASAAPGEGTPINQSNVTDLDTTARSSSLCRSGLEDPPA